MSNVVEFKPRAKAEPESEFLAPDEWYFISDLDTALKIAAYVCHDLEAVDMLMAEIHRFYRSGASSDFLSEDVRQRCARYLTKNEQYRSDVTESIKYIYST
jgi:hypothetical protein